MEDKIEVSPSPMSSPISNPISNPMTRSSTTAGGARRTPLRALLFEDCARDIELILEALQMAAFDVAADNAVTLEDVLARARSAPYDVILADYRMPRNSAMECFAALRAAGINTPFIVVTGSLGDEKAVECLKEGVADYVLKDHLARLPVIVRRALAEQRLRAEQEEAEAALRHSEARYRALVENAPCGMLRLDARDGRLLEANRALAQMLRYPSPADLLENSARAGVALDANLLRRLAGGGELCCHTIGCEIQCTDSQGAPVVVELRGRLLRDAEGAPACLEMTAENLTSRHLAQSRISQLNRLYSVLSHAGQAIVHHRERSRLFREICRILVEEGGFRMAWVGVVASGTHKVEPAARWGEHGDYLKDIQVTTVPEPAGCGPVGTAIRENRRVISNDILADPNFAPWRERALQHNYRSSGAFPLLVAGEPVGALAIYASEVEFFDGENVALLDELAANLSFAVESIAVERMHQRSVDELNQFFALSLEMLCIANREGCIYRLNPAWEQTLGFTARELCSKPWVELVHPADRSRALDAAAALAGGKRVPPTELRFLCEDRSHRWLLFSAAPSAEQHVVFAVASDITERKLLEEQLRSQNFALEEQNRRLQEASRMKSEFLANMSHELRSPLNGIIGFAELLYDGKLGAVSEKIKEFLGRIHKSAKHLLELINGVLDLTKIEAGHLSLYPEPVHLGSLVEEVVSVLDALAVQKKIRIEAAISPQAGSAITDAARFKQVLYNYLSNALKFTNEGGRVTVRLQNEGASEFRLEVSDTGIGIAPQNVARLFTEFQQLDSGASKRYQGTGLGLALTKRIVEAQGGRVGVRSSPGEGSTFFAVFPRYPAAAAAQPADPRFWTAQPGIRVARKEG
jgi:PAS domain S-box-containing protein